MTTATEIATPDYQAVPTKEPKVAYIMSRFPKLTETFILYEMLALEQQGVRVEVFPLIREREEVMHPEARSFVERAHFQPFISWPILQAHLYFLARRPRTYLKALWALLYGTWGSFRFFTGALGLFPKTVFFARQMIADKITHIHAHFASHPTAAAFLIHRLTDIPYSFTAHGSDLHRDQRMLREKMEEAEFVVTISTYNQGIKLRVGGEPIRHKLVRIPCGVDTQIFQPSVTNKHESTTTPFSILCIGTLHEVKGQGYLLEACRQLKERGIWFFCHFVGDGPDRKSRIEQVTRTELEKFVCFHGPKSQTDLIHLLHKMQVVVAPSVLSRDGRREGIPVALMEAMASGIPVVASRISGIPELVENEQTGLLVSPKDATALADALERLYQNPALRLRLQSAAREKILREFNLHTNAAKLAQRFTRQVPL